MSLKRYLLLLAAALSGTAPLFAQATMFRGGADHRGVSDSAAGGFGGVRWRVATDGPVRSSPVVAGGTVYVGWRRRYGGGPGTGFVRVPAVTTGTGSLVNPLVLQLAAELRPR